METATLPVLGAGGYGIVYQLPNGNVIKALYSRVACNEARVETKKQLRVYESFERLRSCKEQTPLIKQINQYVQISRPVMSKDESVVINSRRYECYFEMTKLYGIPLLVYQKFNAAYVESRIAPEYLKTLDPLEYQIQAHLAMNTDITGIYGINYTRTLISKDNPMRGYFANEQSGLIQFLQKEYGLKLSCDEIEAMIGFIYGRIYCDCHIIPVDIEIALGLNLKTNQFTINVMDFGMTFDLLNVEENPVAPRNALFFDIINDTTKPNKEAIILERALNDIDIDLYGSMSIDSRSREGFFIACSLQYCRQCDNTETFKRLKNGLVPMCQDCFNQIMTTGETG